MRPITATLTLTAAILWSTLAFPADAIPAWRGQEPGTAWLGPDVLWRCREGLVFHLLDEKGAGFNLDVAVRDMNTYQQGPRPVLVWLVEPDGQTVFREILPDDGVVSGNEQYRDGLSDMYLDSMIAVE